MQANRYIFDEISNAIMDFIGFRKSSRKRRRIRRNLSEYIGDYVTSWQRSPLNVRLPINRNFPLTRNFRNANKPKHRTSCAVLGTRESAGTKENAADGGSSFPIQDPWQALFRKVTLLGPNTIFDAVTYEHFNSTPLSIIGLQGGLISDEVEML